MKEALCILIKYRLVSFRPNKNEVLANYFLLPDRVLLMIRYPKYINIIKKKFGKDAEILAEELLQRGYSSAYELILHTFARLQKDQSKPTSLAQIREKLFSLITAKYFIRLPYATDEMPVPDLQVKDEEQFALPTVDLKLLSSCQSNPAERLPETCIYWTVNFDRFHQDIRDKLIVNAFSKKFDENVGEFVRILLEQMYIRTEPWADCSNPVPLAEIKDLVRKLNTHPQLVAFFDQYTSLVGKLMLINSSCSGRFFCKFLNVRK